MRLWKCTETHPDTLPGIQGLTYHVVEYMVSTR
jgi:hypothetical protein